MTGKEWRDAMQESHSEVGGWETIADAGTVSKAPLGDYHWAVFPTTESLSRAEIEDVFGNPFEGES